MTADIWQLSVDRTHFVEALTFAGQAGKAVRSATAILTFHDGQLTVDLLGSLQEVSATGTWPCEVRLGGESLEHLARTLQKDDPVILKIEGKKLIIARYSMSCEWRSSAARSAAIRELLPANPDLFDLLTVAVRSTPEEIDAVGATPLIAKADLKVDELCADAAEFLDPYKISPAQLRQICEQHAKDGSRAFGDGEAKTMETIIKVWRLLAPLGVEPTEIKALMDDAVRNAWKM